MNSSGFWSAPATGTREARRSQWNTAISHLDSSIYEDSFREFARAAWHVVEPAEPVVWSWHMDAICEHLQAVTEGHLRALIINVPPRHTKSLLTCVLWPAWEWARDPSRTWLIATYAQVLATRDSVRTRRLIESRWYRTRFPHVKLEPDQNQKTRYDTTSGGYRISTSVGGAALGDGGARRLIDDPHSPRDVHSETVREGVLDWWAETWSSRQVNPATDADVVIMQRLHERDLSGYLLEEVGGFEHLMLPARYEPTRKARTSIGWEDPRTRPGELLNPKRFPEEVLRDLEHRLGEYGTAGQQQQDPKPAGGGIFREVWWRYWIPAGTSDQYRPVRVRTPDGDTALITPRELPRKPPDRTLQSWDLAFKATDGSSLVAGGVYHQHGADVFLIDLVEDRMTFTETVEAMRKLTREHPDVHAKVVEDKANGPAVIDTLQHEIGGMIPSQPYGSKEARAHAVSPRVEAGNVYLPHPDLRPWVERARHALSTFPATTRTDVVDQLTQALSRLPTDAVPYADARTFVRSERTAGRRR